jgi:hypothetical protein
MFLHLYLFYILYIYIFIESLIPDLTTFQLEAHHQRPNERWAAPRSGATYEVTRWGGGEHQFFYETCLLLPSFCELRFLI